MMTPAPCGLGRLQKAASLLLLLVGTSLAAMQFHLVYPGSPSSPSPSLVPLNDGDLVTQGVFDFTVETDDSNVDQVEFSVTSDGEGPVTPPYDVTTGKFFDLVKYSETPGTYILQADSFIGGNQSESLTIVFDVIVAPSAEPSAAPSPAPSAAPSQVPSAVPSTSSQPSSSPSNSPSSSFEPIRINVGGGAFVDASTGNAWIADQYFAGGGPYGIADPIGGAAPDLYPMYQTERSSKGDGAVDYAIPLEAGVTSVDVVVHLCELYFTGTGFRVFDIEIEGTPVISNVDQIILAGAPKYALPLSFPGISVVDGVLDLSVVDVVENAALVGIEVLPSGTGPNPQPTKVFINSGPADLSYTDVFNQEWTIDRFSTGDGTPGTTTATIANTPDPAIFQDFREGVVNFGYDIPVFEFGEYRVTMYFVDPSEEPLPPRIFNIIIEGEMVAENFDIAELAGGAFIAVAVEFNTIVEDGTMNIEFLGVNGQPIVSGIEVELQGPHFAHSVPGGPYVAVDTDDDGFALVPVDGRQSHTHFQGASLIRWDWSLSGSLLASGEQADLLLAVGEYTVSLEVEDSVGNVDTFITTVTVNPKGFPVVDSLSPDSGPAGGGDIITVTGSGFLEGTVTVKFGNLDGLEVTVLSDSVLEVVVPPAVLAIPVDVTVTSSLGVSNSQLYSYIGDCPIAFTEGTVGGASGASLAFGPDGNLYVGTVGGTVIRWTLDENYMPIAELEVAPAETNDRLILGVLVDPFEVDEPVVYIAHSQIYHGSDEAFSGSGINGKVGKLSGPNLEFYEDVVVNLPVSDHDHAINGMEMDAIGDLYILVGGNTNAGVPGALSNNQPDNVFSSTLLVARLSDENFDGVIQYNEAGQPLGNFVEIFAAGLRNPYDVVLHSNGNFYATDNGPNSGFGPESTGCGTQAGDPSEPDEINLLVEGGFYGHANRPYGACVWRSVDEPSDTGCAEGAIDCYTKPMALLPSSTNGITEFKTNHFCGTMRGDLITGKYNDWLERAILSQDGQQVLGQTILNSEGGLDVTQGPDGTLFTARLGLGQVGYVKPVDTVIFGLTLTSVWPYRGPQSGNHKLTLYGYNFIPGDVSVVVGGLPCPVDASTTTETMVECIVPIGPPGKADVGITSGGETSILVAGYERMVKGGIIVTPSPTISSAPSEVPSSSPSLSPSTSSAPSDAPSVVPSLSPSTSTAPSEAPSGSFAPSTSTAPSSVPSNVPSTAFLYSIFINCGGPEYVDGQGNTWLADQYFSGGSTFGIGDDIANTDLDTVYQSERSSNAFGAESEFTYTIPVDSTTATYTVTIHLAELWFTGPGSRVYNIVVQGVEVASNIDHVADVGAKTAYQVVVTDVVPTPSGDIVIDFVDVVENANVVGIQIESQ